MTNISVNTFIFCAKKIFKKQFFKKPQRNFQNITMRSENLASIPTSKKTQNETKQARY